MRVTIDERTGRTVFEDDGTPGVTDARHTPEQAAADRRSLAVFDDSYRTPEQVERDAYTERAFRDVPRPQFDIDPEPGTYKGTIFELTDAREVDEYRRLKRSGEYKDDKVMRLRAMRATRGDEEVRKLAWRLRRDRDQELASRLARRFGGNAGDYYSPTTRLEIQMAHGDYGPRTTAKEAMATYYDSMVAFGRDNGTPAERLAAKRRGRYLAERWGLAFDEDTVPTGRRVDVPVRATDGGWVWGNGGRHRFRVGEGGFTENQMVDARGKLVEYTDWNPELRPTRPGEPVRRKGGEAYTTSVPERRATGPWRISAPSPTALRRALDAVGWRERPIRETPRPPAPSPMARAAANHFARSFVTR